MNLAADELQLSAVREQYFRDESDADLLRHKALLQLVGVGCSPQGGGAAFPRQH